MKNMMKNFVLSQLNGLVAIAAFWIGCWFLKHAEPSWDFNVPAWGYFLSFCLGIYSYENKP